MKKLITRGLAITAAAIVLTWCVSDAEDNKSSSIFEAQPDIKASENTNDNAGGETENIVGQSANSESSQSDEAKEENDYSRYSGVWTTDGISNEELLENGGTKLTLNISNGNQASGSLFSQQGTTDRIANIDFSGEIHDNQLVYSFTDDGWDGKGTLNFTFTDNVFNEYEKANLELLNSIQ
ncbi:hypothetical protein [Butyrivibrio sp. YAB3001]|uniref:hypothetical protein n=1 Tax=Butyrivibrio sp. YAB3001 TaxID=1520812 RepID=UPI0008F66C47|nr:hypothetical protein [Butyrivibrio sp. YAB3001]SFB89505.1 hypothetical protein SAMN02910398_01044 [Butyrivibrio sp. YAB3001]